MAPPKKQIGRRQPGYPATRLSKSEATDRKHGVHFMHRAGVLNDFVEPQHAELKEHEGIDVPHYLIVDAHYTWWRCGRSYLCGILDAMQMGYIDEVLFGREVLERLPVIVKRWAALARDRNGWQYLSG